MRKTTSRLLPVLAATALLGTFGASGAAFAEGEKTELKTDLIELNDSGVDSTAWVTLEGNEVTVKIESSGLLADAPHAQHIHIGGKNQCPDPDMEGSGVDGAIRVTDAADDYGMIAVSLTTEGDTSPDSGLAVERFPVGDAAYERTFEVDDATAESLSKGDGQIVLHGVDHNGSGAYDGDQKSDLTEDLPSEATDPAACGELSVVNAGNDQMDEVPEGGVETGSGTTAGIENGSAMAAGGALILAAGAGMMALRRNRVQK